MWAARYFAPRYWAERFWAKVGVNIAIDVEITHVVAVYDPTVAVVGTLQTTTDLVGVVD